MFLFLAVAASEVNQRFAILLQSLIFGKFPRPEGIWSKLPEIPFSRHVQFTSLDRQPSVRGPSRRGLTFTAVSGVRLVFARGPNQEISPQVAD
jgi:hypothetical protein